jgi:hypothetical protein
MAAIPPFGLVVQQIVAVAAALVDTGIVGSTLARAVGLRTVGFAASVRRIDRRIENRVAVGPSFLSATIEVSATFLVATRRYIVPMLGRDASICEGQTREGTRG